MYVRRFSMYAYIQVAFVCMQVSFVRMQVSFVCIRSSTSNKRRARLWLIHTQGQSQIDCFFPKKSYFFLRKKKKHCLSVTGHDRLPVNNFPKIVNVLHSLVPVLEIVPGHENKTQGTQLSLYSTLLFTLVGYLRGQMRQQSKKNRAPKTKQHQKSQKKTMSRYSTVVFRLT